MVILVGRCEDTRPLFCIIKLVWTVWTKRWWGAKNWNFPWDLSQAPGKLSSHQTEIIHFLFFILVYEFSENTVFARGNIFHVFGEEVWNVEGIAHTKGTLLLSIVSYPQIISLSWPGSSQDATDWMLHVSAFPVLPVQSRSRDASKSGMETPTVWVTSSSVSWSQPRSLSTTQLTLLNKSTPKN